MNILNLPVKKWKDEEWDFWVHEYLKHSTNKEVIMKKIIQCMTDRRYEVRTAIKKNVKENYPEYANLTGNDWQKYKVLI